jgi:hypothetical protein
MAPTPHSGGKTGYRRAAPRCALSSNLLSHRRASHAYRPCDADVDGVGPLDRLKRIRK